MIKTTTLINISFAFIFVTLTGCASTTNSFVYKKPVLDSQIRTQAIAIKDNDEILHSMKQGILLLDAGDYSSALASFQSGLRLNPENGHLHFLHALTYHLQSLSGDSAKLELAETGYSIALKFDPANYWASYFLGQIYFAQKRYIDAQNLFSYGLLYAPENQTLLRALSVASYYSKNVDIGEWAASKANQIGPDNHATLRALLFNRAATGNITGANEMLGHFQYRVKSVQPLDNGQQGNHATIKVLADRINDWERFYKNNKHYAQTDGHPVFGSDAQAEGTLLDLDGGSSRRSQPTNRESKPQAGGSDASDKTLNLPRMAVIDVVILRTEESRVQNRGINLLAGLQSTLGGTLYGRSRQRGTLASVNQTGDLTTYFSPSFTLSGLSYNLNIFNDGINQTEVLARPSLLAVENQTSKFYSGAVLHVQLSSSTADGSLVDIPIGLHLEVTPQFHDDDTIEVAVHAKRDNIEANYEHTTFTNFSQISTTSVDSTAVLKFGETLILSGLSENESNNGKDGVPLLQNIPVIQYLFSNENELQTKKSVIVLLTPRKPQFVNGELTAKEADTLRRQGKQQHAYTLALKNKYGIKMTSNVDSAFAVLAGGDLYREFRNGDLKLDDWHDGDTLAGALRRTMGFLYY